METLFKDIRYGLRGLLKRPAFSAVALVILALGIGANTAIFTLINAVVLKPLPVSKPEELVLFNDSASEGTRTSDDGDINPGRWDLFSYASYRYFREHDASFQDLSAFRSGESRLSVRRADAQSGEAAQRASGHLVSGNYFAVLGVNATAGRVLTNEDDTPSAHPAAVISNAYWKQKLNGDAQIVGKNFLLNGTAFTIVGVMPPSFFGTRVRRSPDYWLPLAFQPQIELRKSSLDNKNVYWLNMIGRLKPGFQIGQAQAGVNAELRQYLTEQAGSQLGDETRLAIQNSYVSLAPGARGLSGLRFFYSQALRMLMVIVALVLLIACANVGNLLLSRAAARQAEISLRQALGASRGRLIRQLLTESLLLALIGGLAGILLAQWGVSVLVARLAATSPLDVKPDAAVLLFTLGISFVSGVVFGIAPALRATKTDLTSALKEKSAAGRRSRFNLGSALVVTQVAVSLVLLVGAGLFARSLINLQQEDLGFNRDNVLLASVDTRLAGYKPAELSSVYRQLYDRLSSLPNVRSASIASYSPMAGSATNSTVTVRGYTPNKNEDMSVADIFIGPDFSETLGVPLLMGREIGLQDTPTSARVAVVNQAFAHAFFHDQNPIGRRLTFEEDSDKDDFEIVGVIGDSKYDNAKEKADRSVFRPILQVQDQQTFNNVFELRTVGDPLSVSAEVRGAIAQVNDKLPILNITSLRLQTDEALKQERLIAQLVSFFGVLGLLLSCVGLYGIMAHAVVRRTNEIGIRMALGAERRNIIWMVLKESLLLVAFGLVIGIPAAWAAAHLISSQLFGLNPSDPITLATAALLLTVVAALAGYLPARKASRVNPLIALRYE
ncbi:MAG TPA: ABC transporter permease [Pyrinomonadaceae bacterium]|jgi:predicted permease|nr:ABC transporter permease [Pyrinomonadaceae bacterium]